MFIYNSNSLTRIYRSIRENTGRNLHGWDRFPRKIRRASLYFLFKDLYLIQELGKLGFQVRAIKFKITELYYCLLLHCAYLVYKLSPLNTPLYFFTVINLTLFFCAYLNDPKLSYVNNDTKRLKLYRRSNPSLNKLTCRLLMLICIQANKNLHRLTNVHVAWVRGKNWVFLDGFKICT